MNIGQQILFAISALGAFNGFALSLYLFFQKKTRTVSIYLLAVLSLAVSMRVAKSVFYFFNPKLSFVYLQIGLSACFLIGPALYYFFRSVREKPGRIPRSWWWAWGILLGIIIIVGILVPYHVYPDAWRHYIIRGIYLQWPAYLILSGFVIRSILKSMLTAPGSLSKSEQFLSLLFLGNCLIYFMYLMAALNVVPGIYIVGGLSFSLVLYITLTFYFYNAPIESLFQSPQLTASYKTEKKKIADSDATLWIGQLEKVIIAEGLHKDPNLKLSELAKKINISTHQLSQLLNDNLGKSFSTYINEYRIEDACKMIATDSRFTFEAIGYEVGFNSKSTFYAVFKKMKGITPALYKENMENTTIK